MTAADAWSAAFTSGAHAAQEYDGIMVPRLFDPWADVLLGFSHVRIRSHTAAHLVIATADLGRRRRQAGRVALAAARD